MRLTPVKTTTFRLALIAAIASFALRFVDVGVAPDVSFWLMAAAFVLLLAGSVFTGL